MYVARILYPVEVLGPGKRIGIWFCGCPRRCKGCSNPELWEFDEKYKTTPETVFEMVRSIAEKHPVEGFTLTGGDPLMQPKDLQKLIALLQTVSTDILVYTGYSVKDLPHAYLKGIAVLIDGEYIEERNNDSLLRGSDNQTVHILDPAVKEKYTAYLQTATNRIQNFTMPDGVVSVGIHKADFGK